MKTVCDINTSVERGTYQQQQHKQLVYIAPNIAALPVVGCNQYATIVARIAATLATKPFSRHRNPTNKEVANSGKTIFCINALLLPWQIIFERYLHDEIISKAMIFVIPSITKSAVFTIYIS